MTMTSPDKGPEQDGRNAHLPCPASATLDKGSRHNASQPPSQPADKFFNANVHVNNLLNHCV